MHYFQINDPGFHPTAGPRVWNITGPGTTRLDSTKKN